MIQYLLSKNGKFYKTCLHSHTTDSDGKLSPKEKKDMYKSHGYSVLALTDHELMVDHRELNDEDFLILQGYEFAINKGSPYIYSTDCHLNIFPTDENEFRMICYNPSSIYYPDSRRFIPELKYIGTPDFKKEYSEKCFQEVIKTAKENNMLVMFNHPTGSLQNHNDMYMFDGVWGLEVYNNGFNSKARMEYDTCFYDYMLRRGNKLFCIAADDSHGSLPPENVYSDNCGGWVMVKADELSYKSIMNSLKSGNFYASTGPEIKELYLEDDILHIKTSAVKRINVNTAYRMCEGKCAEKGKTIAEAEFQIKDDWKYIRIEITDVEGYKAFSNAYFLEDLDYFKGEKNL